jgi:hypothetical protein
MPGAPHVLSPSSLHSNSDSDKALLTAGGIRGQEETERVLPHVSDITSLCFSLWSSKGDSSTRCFFKSFLTLKFNFIAFLRNICNLVAGVMPQA